MSIGFATKCRRVIGGALMLLGFAGVSGCVTPRTLTGGLFATDREPLPVVRVLLPLSDSVMTLAADGRYILRAYCTAFSGAQVYSTGEELTISYTARGITVTTGDGVTLAEEATGILIHTVDPGDRLHINDRPYYGAIVSGFDEDHLPIVVNRLNLDTYLRGVLPPELGERTPDELEAVKAQALAARTYALSRLGQYGSRPYDLRADVSDQVYVGAAQNRRWIDSAIRATRGEVLISDGRLVDAYYHSTCGGFTDAAEDVWAGARPRPYLVSTPDDTFCRWSKYSEWTEEFDGPTLRANLNAFRESEGAPIPEITMIRDLRLEQKTPGGRVARMIVVTPAGEWPLSTDQIRWALGRPSRPGSILPSSRFALALKRDSSGSVIGAVATGSGYGHGIGMCQCGMIGRARAGQTYRHILSAYYHGVQISRVY